MVFYDMQEFGGLEEYAITLAISLQQAGHPVSILSTAWVPPDNQYLLRLRQSQVKVVQPPGWLSNAASDWPTKEKILAGIMGLLKPLVYLLAAGLNITKHKTWQQAVASANSWLSGKIFHRFIEPDRRKQIIRLLLNWWRLRWKPDLLHLHGYTTNLLFVIEWGYQHKVPIVYEEHQTPDPQFGWWQDFQATINKANAVVAVSEKSAQALREVCGVTQPIVVRNPLLPDPLAGGWQRPSDNPTGNSALRMSTFARLYVTKGLNFLLEAIAEVNKKYPQVQFRVYGDGPLRDELLAYAQQLGLDGIQIFVGAFNQQQLPEIMAQTDIYVMSSVLEGQPLALVEAMAYGCPIVTTAVGGIPELIQDGVNGLLCPPQDPSCLAQKIISLIDNPELRKRLGDAARASYERGLFQPAAVRDHFLKIYTEVLDQHEPYE
jgi:glycosyltransferase involved in cell wall biosynthesis